MARIDNGPLLKILLHGAKFSSSSVNGLLIGEAEGEAVHVTDAVPLFHTILNLSPQLEIALGLVDAKLTAQKMGGIVGVYAADALLAKEELDNASRTIANKIASLSSAPSTAALIMDNTKLANMMQEEDSIPFKLYSRTSGTGTGDWRSCVASELETSGAESIKSLFIELLDQHLHKQLYDFDEHLDNPQRDFWNQDLI